MLLVRNIKFRSDESPDEAAVRKAIAAKLRVSQRDITGIRIVKESLDARDKTCIRRVCAFAVEVSGNEAQLIKKARNADISTYTVKNYVIPASVQASDRPVIVGFGPAGMFAGLVLARAGLRPIILERGADADTRLRAVSEFRSTGRLDPESNVQFGEGGAGTFSDGKLNTGTHDSRIGWVLEQFALHGAPQSVTYEAKPHIGTDILVDVVKNIRYEIEALGGEVRFGAKLTALQSERGALKSIECVRDGQSITIACSRLILAIGHSARDSFEMLNSSGISMEPKAFSMGVRIEHRQADIDLSQYGRERGNELPAADYSLSVHLPDGTSAYTFCMCPGGEVIAAASEPGGVVTNGMSLSARAGENANSALLVTLKPEDFPESGVLAGMYWQRQIERGAFEYAGADYSAPAQLLGDFLAGRESCAPAGVKPSYRPGVHWGDVHKVLPERITAVLEKAIPELGRKLKGFDSPDAVLTAPETRSSSPVRIVRDEQLNSPSLRGLYPCGEGAGYAGGITSAAVDGMRCAEAVISSYE